MLIAAVVIAFTSEYAEFLMSGAIPIYALRILLFLILSEARRITTLPSAVLSFQTCRVLHLHHHVNHIGLQVHQATSDRNHYPFPPN